MGKIIKTTGEIIDFIPKNNNEFTMEEIQQVVGGHFEVISTSDFGNYMFINETGKIDGLPLNTKATEIASLNSKTLIDLIVGDVLIATPREAGIL